MTMNPTVLGQSDAPGYAPPAPQGPKVSASWIGMLMAIGAVVTAIGAFLPFEKIVLFDQGSVAATFAFTGLGSETVTGQSISGLKAGNAGKIMMVVAVLVFVLAILVLMKKARLWVGIVATVAAAFGLIMGLASLAAVSSDQKDLRAAGYEANVLLKMGATIATVGVGVMLLAAILALCLRRRQAV
jgi:hypothetical protein